jgi:hypothetical protein
LGFFLACVTCYNTAGGILVGFREDMFDVISCACFKDCVAIVLVDKMANLYGNWLLCMAPLTLILNWSS